MKFLCDRCQTRYSIGDDRVRGKVLKIRCKNCANVITVREGMSADAAVAPAPEAAAPRSSKNTTMAPEAMSQRPAQTPATESPPPATTRVKSAPAALEEEWYVSIDGDQAGPLSLAEAQAWVKDMPADADLHCWSEGFDDWLPVDKVGHFRGMRKRPAASAPPLPSVRQAGAPRAAGSTPPTAAAAGGGAAGGAVAAAAVPAARTEEPKPLFSATLASIERGAPSGGTSRASGGAAAAASAQPARTSRSRPAASAFDVSEADESNTHIDPPPSLAATAAAPPAKSEFGDDDLAIGEVSRVVNLGDLVRSRPKRAATATPARGVAQRRTGTQSTDRPSGIALGPFAPAGSSEPPQPTESMTMAPIAKSHRRGLITLLGVAGILLIGVTGAVFLLVTRTDVISGGSLGQVRDIDTSRPDLRISPRAAQPSTPEPASPAKPGPAAQISRPPPRVAPSAPRAQETTGLGSPLGADEVEDVARKNQDMTQRCYMRSQRGADSILIGDVKKIGVTLVIDNQGNVSDLKLSEHATDNLGKCLTVSMKNWKFRQSPGGTFKFSLNFVGS